MILSYGKKTIELKNCTSFFSRLRGFMFKKNINMALLFDNCNSIHTFFMKENIDVIMCDSDNNILFFYKNLGKGKIIWPKKNVKRVFEIPSNFFDIDLNKEKRVNIK